MTVTVTNTSSLATNVLYLNGTAQATNAGSLTASLPLVVGSGNVIQRGGDGAGRGDDEHEHGDGDAAGEHERAAVQPGASRRREP